MTRPTSPARSLATVLPAVALMVVIGCMTNVPPSVTPSPSPAPSASLPELTPVPGAPTSSTLGGRIACDLGDTCKLVTDALANAIPAPVPVPADHVLVIAPGCPPGDDCLAGIHAYAVTVPSGWRLGDSLTSAWTVHFVGGSVLAKPWPAGSLPEDVLPVVRAAVEGG